MRRDCEGCPAYFDQAFTSGYDIDRGENSRFRVRRLHQIRPKFLYRCAPGDHRRTGRQDTGIRSINLIESRKVALADHFGIEQLVCARHCGFNFVQRSGGRTHRSETISHWPARLTSRERGPLSCRPGVSPSARVSQLRNDDRAVALGHFAHGNAHHFPLGQGIDYRNRVFARVGDINSFSIRRER